MKNKFLTSTLILIISGMSTKLLGLVIKIIFTRIVGDKAISLYTLVMPTYSLLLTIASFAMPTTISKLISEKEDIKVINTATIIIMIINTIIIIIMHLISPFIASSLLKEPDSYYLLIAMSYTLPFASLACILKGYFYGKQKMMPHAISNTVEQIIRLILVLSFMPKLIKISYVHAAVGLIITSLFTELASIIVFLLSMKKEDRIIIPKIKFIYKDFQDIFSLSFPTVSSRIVANIAFFLEPIIITNTLIYLGYDKSYILLEYGAYHAYSISTLTIPSFFVSAISLALIPEITKYLYQKNYPLVKKRLKEAFIYTFILGASFTLLIYIFRDNLLLFLYNTKNGSGYIKYLSPFFILFYFEAIFNSFMQSINKTKITFRITVFTSIIKIISIFLLSFLKIGLYSLLISEIINIILVVTLNLIYMKIYFDKLGINKG